MADNKNQHFVPRCYLRPFTIDGAGKAIRLFNIDKKLAIDNAPVKNQCSRDYFYGRDPKLEGAIQFVEKTYDTIAVDILTRRGPISPGHRTVLRRFIYLQQCRTEAAAKRAIEFAFSMSDSAGIEREPLTPRDALQEAIAAAMLNYSRTMHIVDDLKVCLIQNRTRVSFFTSDDPAVIANRWHQQDSRTKGRSFGARHSGTLYLMPLSPDVHCILYDGDVYSIENIGGWVELKDEGDAHALNEHQILNCAANLYFHDWQDREAIGTAVEAARPRRTNPRYQVHLAALDQETEWGKRYVVTERENLRAGQEVLVHVLTNHPQPSRWPSFLRYRKGGRVFGNNTGAGFSRRHCIEQGFASGVGYRAFRA